MYVYKVCLFIPALISVNLSHTPIQNEAVYWGGIIVHCVQLYSCKHLLKLGFNSCWSSSTRQDQIHATPWLQMCWWYQLIMLSKLFSNVDDYKAHSDARATTLVWISFNFVMPNHVEVWMDNELLSSSGPMGINFSDICIKIYKFSVKKNQNAFENVGKC